MPLQLGYWKTRALQQPVRLLLEYLEVPYEETRYEAKQRADGSWDTSEWFDVKEKMGLDFPNLPYLKDPETGVQIVQTEALHRYIAKKYRAEMAGKTLADQAKVDMLVGVLADLTSRIAVVVYKPKEEYEAKASGLRKAIEALIPSLAKMISGPYICGDYLTFVDFILYERLDVTMKQFPGILEGDEAKQRLTDFHKAIEALPQIASYKKSDRFIERPMNGPMAAFH